MKALLAKIIIAPLLFIGSFFVHNDPVVTKPVQLGDVTLPINGSTYNLSGSGVTSSATSFTLSSLTIPQNGYKIVDADASATFYMTLEPGSRTRQEVLACTTIVQNVAGTATISGCNRGLSPIYPYTASTSLKFAHPGGSQVIFGDAAQLFNEYYALGNVSTSTNTLIFSSTTPPRYDLVPTNQALGTYVATTAELASIAYVNAGFLAGCATGTEGVNGCVRLSTQAQMSASTFSAGTPTALYSKYSTSSPFSATGPYIPITQSSDNKLSSLFIGTSSAYTYNWGAANVFTASTTFLANASNKINFNALSYTFPPTRTASSSVLSDNGSGTLTWEQPFDQVLYVSSPNLDGNAASTTQSFTLPANTINTSRLIRITGLWDSTTQTTCTYGIDYGTGSATTTIAYANAGAGSAADQVSKSVTEIVATSTASVLTITSFKYIDGRAVVPLGVDGVLAQMDESSRFGPYPTTAQNYIAFRVGTASGCKFVHGTIELLSQ